METGSLEGRENLGDPDLEALAIALGFAGAQVEQVILKAAVDLDIPEIIRKHGAEPIKFSDLAASLPKIPQSNHGALLRIMHSLCSMHLVDVEKSKTCDGDDLFSLTLAGRYYARGYEKSLVNWQAIFRSNFYLRGLGCLGSWLIQEETKTSFELGNGDTHWGCASTNSDFNDAFNKAMECNSEIISQALIQNYPQAFDGVESLVDVGGGTGITAKAICTAFPGIKACTVLDLPHVIKDLDSEDMTCVNFVSGDMFESIPMGDAVLLVCVLHNWDDKNCLKILRRCKEALTHGKIIIVDIVLEKGDASFEA